MGKLTKPRMESILVMYIDTVRVQTSKDDLSLDCIVAFELLGGSSKNGMSV